MLSPAQVARLANVTPQTIRNYTREYAHLLSTQASGKSGNRLFTDEDVRILCAIADLRKSGVPPHEIASHLREETPPIIDITPQSPSNADFSPQMPLVAQSHVVARFDALETRIDNYMTELRAEFRQRRKYDVLWGMLLGAILALVAGGFLLFVMWLVTNGASLARA
jgi:DNA-binding transcriptional MerR regulator